jgi:hypothetical protein
MGFELKPEKRNTEIRDKDKKKNSFYHWIGALGIFFSAMLSYCEYEHYPYSTILKDKTVFYQEGNFFDSAHSMKVVDKDTQRLDYFFKDKQNQKKIGETGYLEDSLESISIYKDGKEILVNVGNSNSLEEREIFEDCNNFYNNARKEIYKNILDNKKSLVNKVNSDLTK